MRRLLIFFLILTTLTGCRSGEITSLKETEVDQKNTVVNLDNENDELKNTISNLNKILETNESELTTVLNENRILEDKLGVSNTTLEVLRKKNRMMYEIIAKIHYDLDVSDVEEIINLLPEGWLISKKNSMRLAIAKGDLNQDNIDDLAFVIDEDNNYERNLIIAFGNSNGNYTITTRSIKAIMGEYSGGGWGDPFANLVIQGGILKLEFFGGSHDRFFMEYDFIYNDGSFNLINAITGWHITLNEERVVVQTDNNLVTGEYTIKEIVNGEIVTRSVEKSVDSLIKLEDFIAEPDSHQYER